MFLSAPIPVLFLPNFFLNYQTAPTKGSLLSLRPFFLSFHILREQAAYFPFPSHLDSGFKSWLFPRARTYRKWAVLLRLHNYVPPIDGPSPDFPFISFNPHSFCVIASRAPPFFRSLGSLRRGPAIKSTEFSFYSIPPHASLCDSSAPTRGFSLYAIFLSASLLVGRSPR